MNTGATNLTPVLSRRTVNETMAARGLRSAADLAAEKPCGTRVRYYAGCRCAECRAANSRYECERYAARARGEGNGLVDAQRARVHLAWLSAHGVGSKTAADSAKVAGSIVSKIIYGQRLKIREQTERRILAVTLDAAADRAYIDGAPTWKLLDELLANGYSKARIATEIAGRPMKSLQLRRGRVTVRNAALARQAYEQLQLASAALLRQAHRQIAELREEGFRLDRIQREVDQLSSARGWGGQTISPPTHNVGRWPQPARLTHRAAELIDAVHAKLLDE